MGHRRKAHAPGARAWIGNLLAAWTLVTALAVTFASAWWFRTRDLEILLAAVGAPFAVGLVLFLALGILALATRGAPHEPVEPDGVRARKQKEGWFGKG